MTETLEIVNDLPAVAEKKFFSELEKLEITKQKLIERKDECLALKVTDKESCKKADTIRKEEKKKRVVLKNKAKDLRVPHNEAIDKIIELEKEYSDIIAEGEDYLETKVKAFEEKEAKEKREKMEREQIRYNKRLEELFRIGVIADGNTFLLDDMRINGDLVKGADDDIYQETIYLPFKALFDKHEAERLEKERIERERQALWQRQQAEMEEERRKFAEEKRLYEEQQQKRKDAEFQARVSQLSAMALYYEGITESFVFEDIAVSKAKIITSDEAEWTKLINELTPIVIERKAAAEREKEREIQRMQRIDGRSKELMSLGFFVTNEWIIGFGQKYSLGNLDGNNSEFNEFLDVAANAKAQFQNAEKERIKQEIIAEEKRQLEIKRLKEETELAEATDGEKWAFFKKEAEALLHKIPTFKSQRFMKAASMSKEKLEDLISIVPSNLLRNK